MFAIPSERRVLVTGSTGFVGAKLCDRLTGTNQRVVRVLRDATLRSPNDVILRDLADSFDWTCQLKNIDCIVHLAARTHVLQETADAHLEEYRRINVHATERLANEAASAGVRRFVFLSSVKVNGESTLNHPFSDNDTPAPVDAYGKSKLEAEHKLNQISRTTGLEVVILRPTLIYGPGVKGNFFRLMQIIESGLPLPLALIDNKRSFLYVENLVDVIIRCLDSPAVIGKTYLVSDNEAISTPCLVQLLSSALGITSRLFPVPVPILEFTGWLLGKRSVVARLTESLQVDSSRIRNDLVWQPRYTLAFGIQETAGWYRGR